MHLLTSPSSARGRDTVPFGQPPASPREWPAAVWPVATAAAAGIGTLASMDAPSFYAQLAKPDWAPPAWVFGPMWTMLYVLMATAAYRVARTGHALRRSALGMFGAQLVANAAWSWLFFGLHRGGLALAGAGVLLMLTALTALLFGRVRTSTGWMMAPAVAWVSLATALTASVWMRNPALLGG